MRVHTHKIHKWAFLSWKCPSKSSNNFSFQKPKLLIYERIILVFDEIFVISSLWKSKNVFYQKLNTIIFIWIFLISLCDALLLSITMFLLYATFEKLLHGVSNAMTDAKNSRKYWSSYILFIKIFTMLKPYV